MERDEHKLDVMEAEYAALLKAALQKCASGQWGLLGQNDAALQQLGRHARARWSCPEADELLELGSQIERLRGRLGFAEPFTPHERLLRTRSLKGANTPGEPRLAREWLDEIG
jgi:2'-5' RNA ligase